MKNIKGVAIDFISALLAMSWAGGMFLSITKQLNADKVYEILPVAAVSAAVYAVVQLMAKTMIDNKNIAKFVFLIPAATLLSLGFMPTEQGNMNFFVCGAGLLLAGYGNLLKLKKQAQIQQANGN